MLRSRTSGSEGSTPLMRRSIRGVLRSMVSFRWLFPQGRGPCRHRWSGWSGGGERRQRQLCRRFRLPSQLTGGTNNGGLTRLRRRRAAELQSQPLGQRRPLRSVTIRPGTTIGPQVRGGRRLVSRALGGPGPLRLHAGRVPRRRLPRPRRRRGGPLRPPRPPRPIRSGLPVDKVVGPLAFIAKAGLSNAMIPYFRFSEVAEEFLRDGPLAPQAR